MNRKSTAYCFLLLANIVLLAHAVIPHHHHYSVICFEQKCYFDNAIPNKKNVPEHGHGHDDTHNSTCLIIKEVIIPSSKDKAFLYNDNYSGNHNHNFYIVSYFGLTDLQPYLEVATHFPVHSSHLLSFVTSTLGLRGPPIV